MRYNFFESYFTAIVQEWCTLLTSWLSIPTTSRVTLICLFFIQLSQLNICSYQDLNYTLNFISQTNTTSTLIGPFQQQGYNTITHLVMSGIEENLEYYLVVNIETATGEIASEEYYFSK